MTTFEALSLVAQFGIHCSFTYSHCYCRHFVKQKEATAPPQISDGSYFFLSN